MKTCLTCKFCKLGISKDLSQGICRFDPPTAAIAVGPQGPVNLTVRVVIDARQDWCSHYTEALVAEEQQAPREHIALK